jgi:alpha-galactosidase
VSNLEKRIAAMTRWANDPQTDMVQAVGTDKTREQIVPIMDGLINNVEGYFQVNVPNHGALTGLPDDLVVEVPAIVNQKGIQPVRVGALPPKIMFGQILPDWLDTERELLAFQTGDRSILLYGVLNHHQTKNYAQAVAILEELMELDEVKEVEDWEKMKRISDHYKYPAKL